MTVGTGCDQKSADGKSCAWTDCAFSARLHKSLEQMFPGKKIMVTNEAHGGQSSLAKLPAVGEIIRRHSQVDLWILDYMVNDVFEPKAQQMDIDAPKLLKDKELQLQKSMFIKIFGKQQGMEEGPYEPEKNAVVMSMSLERLIQTLHGRHPESHIMVLSCGAPFCYNEKNAAVRGNQSILTEHYNLMYGDIAEAFHHKPEMWVVGDRGFNHPEWPAHQYIADGISAHLKKAVSRVSLQKSPESIAKVNAVDDTWPTQSYWPQKYLDLLCPCCETGHLTRFEARAAKAAGPGAPGPSGTWNLEEDVQNKPGWISQTPGAHLTFPAKFGSKPTLEMSYLRSYEGMGSAQVSLRTASGTKDLGTLKGMWSRHQSIEQPFIVHPDVAPNSEGTIDIVLQPGTDTKMKFVYFGSC